LGTFKRKVNAYIALSEFSKTILVRSGLPEDRMFVKSNFAVAPQELQEKRCPQVIFVGKISVEKGVHLLLQAWREAHLSAASRLLLIGDGPDRADLEQRSGEDSSIVWWGRQPREQVTAAIARSRMLALPSLCYENCPMAVLEAFSVGTPVLVPDHGPFPELVSHQKDGLLFSSGNASSLADALRAGLNASAKVWSAWSRGARNKYLAEYTDSLNYEHLMSIYNQTIDQFRVAQSQARDSGRLLHSKT